MSAREKCNVLAMTVFAVGGLLMFDAANGSKAGWRPLDAGACAVPFGPAKWINNHPVPDCQELAEYRPSATPHKSNTKTGVRHVRNKPRPRPTMAVPSAAKPVLTRPEFSEQDQLAAEVPGFSGVRFWSNSVQDYVRAIPATPGPWLALSSGGEDGAYGAGFLAGWTASGKRPDFPVIIGVSTGALMAGYAFAGPKYDAAMREAYTSISAADIFEMNPTPESLVDTWPLKRLIDKNVTAELLADIAAQHRQGRRLLVQTTNLDAGRGVIWNMGAIAAKGGQDALALFRSVLLASASVPGAFPPVYIAVDANGRRFQEMHVDGGVNGPLYVAPESYLDPASTHRLPMSKLFIILNGKATPEFAPPRRMLATILGRSIWLSQQMGARMDLVLFYQAAQRDKVDFNLALVDAGFDNKTRGAFDPDYMKSLYDHGFEQGRRGQFFKAFPSRQTTAANDGAGAAPVPRR